MGISFLNDEGVINTIRNISTMQRSLLMTRKKTINSDSREPVRDEGSYPIQSERMRKQIGALAQKLTDLDKDISKSKLAVQKISELEDQLIDLREITEGATESVSADDETLEKYRQGTAEIAGSFNDILQSAIYANEKLFDGSDKAVSQVDDLQMPEIKSPQDAVEALNRIDNSFKQLSNLQQELTESINSYNLSFQSNLEHTFDNMAADNSNIESSQNANEYIQYINLLVQYKQGDPRQVYNTIRNDEVFGLLS